MASERPTLLRHVLRRHTIAGSLTLLVTLVVILFLADQLALQSAKHELAERLRETDTQTTGMRQGRGGGRIVLDITGRPVSGGGGMRGGGGPWWRESEDSVKWALAPEIVKRGQLQGVGSLPWVSRPVVWAARYTDDTGAAPYIQVMWTGVDAVRGTAQLTYLLVIGTVVLAFLISLGFLVRTVRGVTRALTDVAAAGQQMAAGDFAVSVPEQNTRELDNLRTVVTNLASHLDNTMANLNTEHEHLVRLERAQRQFVADASHELRAPLSSIILTLDAWHDGLLSPNEQVEAVDHLRDETRRLSRMVEQLLDLSRIESGRHPISLGPTDAAAVAGKVVQALTGQPGAVIRIDIPPDLPQVVADQDALHRVIRNLLDNARRFTAADGSISVWARVEGERVRIGVTDNGRGIPAQAVDRIWERFSRAERERAGGDIGTGLGLAIVKALAEAMGGDVGLTSKEGAGTTVWVSLKPV